MRARFQMVGLKEAAAVKFTAGVFARGAPATVAPSEATSHGGARAR
jgi:hypothetical protein